MQLINNNKKLRRLDEDAKNFINKIRDVDGVILSQSERWQANYMVSGFKSIGVWEKMKAVYLMLGGTAATHRWNAKDMRDEDDAYRITWHGGITHSDIGVEPNGIDGWADTNISHSIFNNGQSIAIYTTKEGTKSVYDTSILSDGLSAYNFLSTYDGGLVQFLKVDGINLDSGVFKAGATLGKSFTIGSKSIDGNMYVGQNTLYSEEKNGYQSLAPTTGTYKLFGTGYSNGTTGPYSDKGYGCIIFSDALNINEAKLIENIIYIGQRILNRA